MAAQPPSHTLTMPSPSASSLSSSQQEDSETPLPLLNQTENIELFYVQKEQKMPVVVAMSVGLSDGMGSIFGNDDEFALDKRFPSKNKSKWKPKAVTLIDEIMRRKKNYYEDEPAATNQQTKKSVAMEWLRKNPIPFPPDIDWVQQKISVLFEANKQSETQKQNNSRDQWSGIVPFLRLIHCIFEVDNTKEALQKSFTVMSRQELDGRNSEDNMRICPWKLASDSWNDSDYNPVSSIYINLHNDFHQTIDLSHSEVIGMGILTPDKAKIKYNKMKNELIIVKMNYEKSGNGDGSLREQLTGGVDSEDYEIEQSLHNACDVSNFLAYGQSPALLYLWKKAEEYNFIGVVCQQLSFESSLDTCNEEEDDDTGTEASSKKRKKRKRKTQEDENCMEEKEQFEKMQAMMNGCNEALIASTIKMEDATKATLFVNINSRIDATQRTLDEFDDALDDLNDDDNTSKKYLRLIRRRQETVLKLKKLELQSEQYK